jgi:heat shock protein HslJ
MRIVLLGLLLGASLTATACRASADASGVTAAGRWRLVALEEVDLTALDEAPELVIGADGALSGYGGVNRFSGQSDAEALRAGRLRAVPLISTRRAGPPAAMEAEARFFAVLGATPEWRRSDGALELVQDGVVKARFLAVEP